MISSNKSEIINSFYCHVYNGGLSCDLVKHTYLDGGPIYSLDLGMSMFGNSGPEVKITLCTKDQVRGMIKLLQQAEELVVDEQSSFDMEEPTWQVIKEDNDMEK